MAKGLNINTLDAEHRLAAAIMQRIKRESVENEHLDVDAVIELLLMMYEQSREKAGSP